MAAEKDSYSAGVNEDAQADATAVILDQIFARKDLINGVTLFSFTDGWWKAESPINKTKGAGPLSVQVSPIDGAPNEEYWGIRRTSTARRRKPLKW